MLFAILAMVILSYAFILFVQINLDIRKENARLAETQTALKNVTIENEQLERYSSGENLGEYMERIARDEFGYADPQERVYYIVPGG
ncbi:MAG: septum formation initiator family protein [Oscillospiraceae bacterium]|nr:septum formation initiator family protein [Oscillospiraceae bacterium]